MAIEKEREEQEEREREEQAMNMRNDDAEISFAEQGAHKQEDYY